MKHNFMVTWKYHGLKAALKWLFWAIVFNDKS